MTNKYYEKLYYQFVILSLTEDLSPQISKIFNVLNIQVVFLAVEILKPSLRIKRSLYCRVRHGFSGGVSLSK
jgi:hypothetical protein